MKALWVSLFSIFLSFPLAAQMPRINVDELPYELYPAVNADCPAVPSPFIDNNGEEYVLAVTNEQQYALIPVTLRNQDRMCKQLIVDKVDFPVLAQTGLHDPASLPSTRSITGRSVEKITELGRPGNLSQAGFLAEDETILSVLLADNRLVTQMELTHPDLAKPLFHILNMMQTDLDLDRWNMARHRWEHIPYFYYNGRKVIVEAEDTKGGQLSIFNDGLQGAFYIQVKRELEEWELAFLKKEYAHLNPSQFEEFVTLLSSMQTGELQPQYIMRYGFYEGHTFWRTDPIAIAFIFGLHSLEELHELFAGRLYEELMGTGHKA